MKKIKFIALGIVCLLSACVLKKIQAFSECEFKLDKVNSLSIAGVAINPTGQTKLTMQDALKLAAALSSKSLPVNLDLDISGKNENAVESKMVKFDWKIEVKEEEVVAGEVNKAMVIPAKATKVIDLNTGFDLYPVASKYNMDEIKSLINNAFDAEGNPKEIKIFMKPYISIGKINVPYPGFIEVSKYYKSK